MFTKKRQPQQICDEKWIPDCKKKKIYLNDNFIITLMRPILIFSQITDCPIFLIANRPATSLNNTTKYFNCILLPYNNEIFIRQHILLWASRCHCKIFGNIAMKNNHCWYFYVSLYFFLKIMWILSYNFTKG